MMHTERVEVLKVSQLPPHIAIEGNSGAGKSTLLKELHNLGFATIEEYYMFLQTDIGESFPKFPPKSIESVRASNALWVDLEIRRSLERLTLAKKSNTAQVIDRSPISLLAFEEAKKRIGLPADFLDLPTKLLALYENKVLREPVGYIHLHCSINTIQGRREGLVLPFLITDETVAAIDTYTQRFLTTYVPANRFLVLDTDLLSAREVRDESSQFIEYCLSDPVELESIQRALQDHIADTHEI